MALERSVAVHGETRKVELGWLGPWLYRPRRGGGGRGCATTADGASEVPLKPLTAAVLGGGGNGSGCFTWR